MRPDQRWFPTSRAERAVWFDSFTKAFVIYGPQLGFSAQEIASVVADNAMVQYLLASRTQHEAYISSLRFADKLLLLGSIGERTPDMSPPPSISPPPAVATGIFDRLDKLVKRIRVQPGYSPTVGISLGIQRRYSERIQHGEFVPKFSARVLAEPYTFEIKFVKKKFLAIRPEIKRKGLAQWESFSAFGKSPAIITIVPSNPGFPETIDVRIIMCENPTELLGNYSDTHTITVTP